MLKSHEVLAGLEGIEDGLLGFQLLVGVIGGFDAQPMRRSPLSILMTREVTSWPTLSTFLILSTSSSLESRNHWGHVWVMSRFDPDDFGP